MQAGPHGSAFWFCGQGTVPRKTPDVELAQGHLLEGLLQPLYFRRIQVQSALRVGENESVQNHALGVGERLSLDNVHAEAGYASGQRGKKNRLVSRDDGDAMHTPPPADLHGHASGAAALPQLDVRLDLRRRMRTQVTHRESLDEFGR